MSDSNEEKNSQPEKETTELVGELDQEAQLKLEVIQTLLEPCDRQTYGKKLKEAAEKLGKSTRTVQRLVKKWEQDGNGGLIQTLRSDRGSHRINHELEKFILKTYQDGNKGSRRITPNTIYEKVCTVLREFFAFNR